jgi:ubiquinone/menaquinone biosynthesis C-methylase UbiE
MMDFEEVKNYWNGRAKSDSSVQSTTQDVFLREIELNCLVDRIKKYSPLKVADVGSGDGRTTIGVAKYFSDISFCGFDYSSSMINNARTVHIEEGGENVNFELGSILDGLPSSFDLIYTTRCLINLPSWQLQKQAIEKIYHALSDSGHYIMIENFLEGQHNFNKVRRDFGLAEIPVREHNLFFQHDALLNFTNEIFELVEEINISSSYYLASRVIYSKMCAESGELPDYFNAHHRYAANLPFSGEFGPVRLLVFKKRNKS